MNLNLITDKLSEVAATTGLPVTKGPPVISAYSDMAHVWVESSPEGQAGGLGTERNDDTYEAKIAVFVRRRPEFDVSGFDSATTDAGRQTFIDSASQAETEADAAINNHIDSIINVLYGLQNQTAYQGHPSGMAFVLTSWRKISPEMKRSEEVVLACEFSVEVGVELLADGDPLEGTPTEGGGSGIINKDYAAATSEAGQ
jgi:hypothetical protein